MHECAPYSSYSPVYSTPESPLISLFCNHKPPPGLGVFYSTLPFRFCNTEVQRITLGIFRTEKGIKLIHKPEFLLGKRVVRQQAGNISKLITSSLYARYASMQDKSPNRKCNIWDYSCRHYWSQWIPGQCSLLTISGTACGASRTKWFPPTAVRT